MQNTIYSNYNIIICSVNKHQGDRNRDQIRRDISPKHKFSTIEALKNTLTSNISPVREMQLRMRQIPVAPITQAMQVSPNQSLRRAQRNRAWPVRVMVRHPPTLLEQRARKGTEGTKRTKYNEIRNNFNCWDP